jgi:hypothetical protein
MDESIGAIESMRQRLGSDYRTAIIHRDIGKSQFVRELKNLRISGASRSDGTIIDKSKMTNRLIVMNLYRRGSVIRHFSEFIFRSHLGLLQTIDGIDNALKNGNLLVLLILVRSAIEHIGHSEILLKKIRIESIPDNWEKAYNLLEEKEEILLKYTAGTTIDWEKLARNEISNSPKPEEYKRDPSIKPDRTPVNTLSGVDALEKKIKGIRFIYDLLCDFAHPNVGVLFSLKKSARPVRDERYDFDWVEMELSPGAPEAMISEMGKPIAKIFELFAKCLNRFDAVSEELGKQKDSMSEVVKLVIRTKIQSDPKVIWPYCECPCGSGAKVRYCCGRK